MGTRKVMKMGGSLVVTLPAQFVHAHDIKAGDDLSFVAGYIMQLIPMPEACATEPSHKSKR